PRPLAGRHLRGGHPHARARRPRVGRRADQPGAHGAQGRCFDALVSGTEPLREDRKSTRLNSSHSQISYAVFCLKKKKIKETKKPVLMDLCKAYGLDPSGTKEQLRERLLSYLDDSEAERRPGTSPMEIPIVFPQA